MSNIIEFGKKEQWASGRTVCMGCGHKEVAVAPLGVIDMECSNCHTMKSRWEGEFRPKEDVRTCNCGNQYFYLTREGHFCPNCGTTQRY